MFEATKQQYADQFNTIRSRGSSKFIEELLWSFENVQNKKNKITPKMPTNNNNHPSTQLPTSYTPPYPWISNGESLIRG